MINAYPAYNPNPYPQFTPNYGGYMSNPALSPMQTPQQPQPQIQQPQPQKQAEQLVNGGFSIVPTIDDIKRYPVAPGNFVIFKLQNKPFIIEKSMSFSQLDDPHYKCFQEIDINIDNLTPNNEEKPQKSTFNEDISAIKSDINAMNERIDELQNELSDIRKAKTGVKKTAKQQEDKEDE